MQVAARTPVKRIWLIGSLLLGCLFGIALSWLGWRVSITTLSLALLAVPLLWLRQMWLLPVALGLGLAVGVWRGGAVLTQLGGYETHYSQKVAISGTVIDDPTYAGEPPQLEFHIESVTIDGTSLPGKVRVRSIDASVLRGDRVVVEGKLFPGFASWQGSISYAKVHVINHSANWLERFRRNFLAGTYSALPDPQASLGLGFLVGTRGLLPEELTSQLQRTGLTHIVAVSGYNLTILVRFARRTGSKFSKRLAALLAVGLVLGFLAIAGGSASIVRASAVVAFALSAWYYGRRISPIILLLLSSAATALLNPLFFWFDLGWWLSFVAFFGILIVAPLLKTLLFKDKKPHSLVQILLETSSAQLMTIPLTVSVFGELSMMALIANVIILPLVPFAMLLSFRAGLGGMLLPAAASWIAWPAQLLLGFMVAVVELLARPSWALLGNMSPPRGFMIASYFILGITSLGLYWWLRRRKLLVFTESVIE
jgi:competence protein ComEC